MNAMKSVTLIALNAKYCHTSLAVRSIAAACRKRGIRTEVLEHSVNEPFRELMKAVLRAESDVYAFSCYLWNIELVRRMCADLKQMKPDCRILLGGPEVSYDPHAYPFADVVVCGEGEISVPDYLCGTENGSVIYGVPVEPLDNLPFCYSDQDLEVNRHRLIYYESSRGCPYSCSYCLSSVERGVRWKRVETVCAELKRFDDAGVDLVKFVDRTFNADRKRAMAIWKFAAEECRHTRFHFELAGELLGEEELAYLASVPKGKFQFEIGIQSTNPKTLDAVDRRGSLPVLFDRIARLIQCGTVPVHTDLIVGMPYESYERFQQSFNEAYRLGSDCLQVGFLKLLKGSKIRNEAERFGYRYSRSAPYEIYDNEFLTAEQVFRLEAVAETVERFYNSHAFEKSLEYAVSKYESPFLFYESFSFAFDRLGAVAQKTLYEIFYRFYSSRFSDDRLFREALRFDWLRHTFGSPVPSYLGREETLQPLLFRLLDEPGFRERYLNDLEGLKKKEVVKRTFLAKFEVPSAVYCLFGRERVQDVTEFCEKIDKKS